MSLLNKENKKDIAPLDLDIGICFTGEISWSEKKCESMYLIIEKFVKENIINILKDKQFAISKFANIFRRNGMDYDPDILDIRYYYEQESSGNNITLYFKGVTSGIIMPIMMIDIGANDDQMYNAFREILN